MRVSSPSSTSPLPAFARVLTLIGTAALLFLVIILITGGVTFDVGPLHVSAHRWRDPLIIAVAAWCGVAVVSRGAFRDAAHFVHEWLDAHATAVALLVAAAAAGVGVGYGTYAASGADASGYISQAALLSTGRLAFDDPLAREFGSSADATWAVAPLGYRPGSTVGEVVPTYPPGLPLLMAAARLIGGTVAPYLIVPILGGCVVFWTYVLGARLLSRQAGLAAATLLATSPIFLFQVVQPMSDVPTTAWWLLALLFATSSVPAAALAAGATSGLAVLTRPNLLPLVIAVLVALTLRRRPSPLRQAAHFIVGLLPAVGALLLVQWRLYGSPFASGYGSFEELFTAASLWPNVLAYGWRLITGELPALVLLAASTTLLVLVPRAVHDDRQQPSLTTVVAIAAAMWAIVLACYLPYAVFAEWSYLRFLLPALPLLFIVIASIATVALSRSLHRTGAIVMLLAVAAAGSANIRMAAREQAFHLRDFEARYRLAGEYLASALPSNAVIVTVQESGSLHHYTGRSVLRWDANGLDLDANLATLREHGRPAVLVVEDWEATDLRARFPASSTARLDWQPRATVPGTTTVRVFDPMDRSLPAPHAEDIVR